MLSRCDGHDGRADSGRRDDGSFVSDPIIPEDWDYFMVDGLYLNGQRYRIFCNKDGTHYDLGTGLNIVRQ